MSKSSWPEESAFEHFVKHVLCIDERWEDVPDSAPLIKCFGSRRQFARWRTQMLEQFEGLTGVKIYENLRDRLSNNQMQKRGKSWKGHHEKLPAVLRAKQDNPKGLEQWYALVRQEFKKLKNDFLAHVQFMIEDGASWEMSCDYEYAGRQQSAFISKYAQITFVGNGDSEGKVVITSFRINQKSEYSSQITDLKKQPKWNVLTRKTDREKWDALNYTKPSDIP